MKEATNEQIEKWKEQYGNVYQLTADDGKIAYIKDPLIDFRIVRVAFTALDKEGAIGMAASIINNCWLAGDDKVKTEERYGNGLASQIDNIMTLPEYEVKHEGTHYSLSSEGESIKVRAAKRADIIAAENRNDKGEAFMTASYLLDLIAVDSEQLKGLKLKVRSYLGILRATNEVKDKAYVSVKKL